MRHISTSNGWRSFKSVECGLRPNASEISLPAPANFPFGDDHVTSTISVVLTLCIAKSPNGRNLVNSVPMSWSVSFPDSFNFSLRFQMKQQLFTLLNQFGQFGP